MQYKVILEITVNVPDQGNQSDNDLMAAAMACKLVAENCQFDAADDVDIPPDSRVWISHLQPLAQ